MSPYASSLLASLCFYASGALSIKSGNPGLGFTFIALGCVFFLLAKKKRRMK
jgi:hypothetical protein